MLYRFISCIFATIFNLIINLNEFDGFLFLITYIFWTDNIYIYITLLIKLNFDPQNESFVSTPILYIFVKDDK